MTGGMSLIQRAVLKKFYAKAGSVPERLPWHRAEPDEFLVQAAAERGGRGRVLDVGCGSGVFSAWLAAKGFDVVAIDLYPEAVEMARRAAAPFGSKMTVVQADILAFDAEAPFDVVLDSGCLHCLSDSALPAYKARLLRWLAPGGDFILGHFDRRHAFDWRPVGPRRRTPNELVRLFEPELEVRATRTEEMAVPLPIGPVVRGTAYWLKRA